MFNAATKETQMSRSQIAYVLMTLENGLSTIRKSGDREMMRETVIRIRQLRGILSR